MILEKKTRRLAIVCTFVAFAGFPHRISISLWCLRLLRERNLRRIVFINSHTCRYPNQWRIFKMFVYTNS